MYNFCDIFPVSSYRNMTGYKRRNASKGPPHLNFFIVVKDEIPNDVEINEIRSQQEEGTDHDDDPPFDAHVILQLREDERV